MGSATYWMPPPCCGCIWPMAPCRNGWKKPQSCSRNSSGCPCAPWPAWSCAPQCSSSAKCSGSACMTPPIWLWPSATGPSCSPLISYWLARLGEPAAEAEGSRALVGRCSTQETATNVSPTLAGLAEARPSAPGSMGLHPGEVAPRRELSGAAGRKSETQWGQRLRRPWLEPRLPIRPLPRPVRKPANRELAAPGAPARISSGPRKGQSPPPLQRPPHWTA
jgi:hypothetical protein